MIDWANAANGPGEADVALIYVIGKTSTIDGPGLMPALLRVLRHRFLDTFVAAAAEPGFSAVLPAVTAWR